MTERTKIDPGDRCLHKGAESSSRAEKINARSKMGCVKDEAPDPDKLEGEERHRGTSLHRERDKNVRREPEKKLLSGNRQSIEKPRAAKADQFRNPVKKSLQ